MATNHNSTAHVNLTAINVLVSEFLNCFNSSAGDCDINVADKNYTELADPSTTASSNGTFFYFEHPEEMLSPWKINPYFIPVMITYAITFIYGVIGNVTVIIVMLSDRVSQNVTHVFFVSLAVSDLLLLLICIPLDVAKYLVIELDMNGVVCKLINFAEMLSAFASVLNLSAVSLERFIVIVYPMRSRSLCTMSNCRKSLFIVWIVSILLASPFIVRQEITKNTYTNHNTTVTLYLCYDRTDNRRIILCIYSLMLLFVVPLLLMVIFYSLVIFELWISTKTMAKLTQSSSCEMNEMIKVRRNRTNSPSRVKSYRVNGGASSRMTERDNKEIKRARRQVIKMLILVVFLFLICWGPRVITDVIKATSWLSYDHSLYTTRVITFLLPFVHSCLNPIVYGFMSSNFRRMLARSCDRTCSSLRRVRRPRVTTNRPVMPNSRSYSSCSTQNGGQRHARSTYNYSLSTELSNTKVTEIEHYKP